MSIFFSTFYYYLKTIQSAHIITSQHKHITQINVTLLQFFLFFFSVHVVLRSLSQWLFIHTKLNLFLYFLFVFSVCFIFFYNLADGIVFIKFFFFYFVLQFLWFLIFQFLFYTQKINYTMTDWLLNCNRLLSFVFKCSMKGCNGVFHSRRDESRLYLCVKELLNVVVIFSPFFFCFCLSGVF